MKAYPARFVGEIDYPEAYGSGSAPHHAGDVRRVREYVDGEFRHGPYLAIDCGCGVRHVVALAPYAFPGNHASWRLTSENPVHFDPSVLTDYGPERCHFFVHGGRLEMLDDTTRSLLEMT